jgi:thiol-disulfide isomerase/thioredoxin
MILLGLNIAVKTMSAGMKCRISKPGDEKKFIVYTAKWCGACKKQVPMIQTLAQMYGFEVELLDVDSEDPEVQRRVQHVRFVPHIEYLGLEITFDEFVGIVKESVGDVSYGQDRVAA